MRSELTITAIAATLVAASSISTPSFAAGAAQSTSVKFGYFNLVFVKASYPEAAGSEALRVQADSQLRADVERGNDELKKLQDEKKPKEEIEKAARDLQAQVNAKQQALVQLVQTQAAAANRAIASAVAQVGKERGLEVVVDGAGVFSGGDRLVNSGEDITPALLKSCRRQPP